VEHGDMGLGVDVRRDIDAVKAIGERVVVLQLDVVRVL
jgi:hypothetical protein